MKILNCKGFGMSYVLLFIAVFSLLGGVGYYIWQTKQPKITSFDECIAAGNQVQDSYPRKCIEGNVTFVEKLIEKDAEYLNENGNKMLVVSDWGIVLKLSDADKIKLTVTPKSNINPEIGPFEAFATPTFIDSYFEEKKCQPRISLYRSQIQFKAGTKQKEIAGYYYAVSGFQDLICDRRTAEPKSDMTKKFLNEFSVDNIEAN